MMHTQAFKLFDEDGSGKIDAVELKQTIQVGNSLEPNDPLPPPDLSPVYRGLVIRPSDTPVAWAKGYAVSTKT